MALEYGINFNTEKGRKQAEEEIKKWREDFQKYLNKNPLNIGLSGKDAGSVKTATTQLQGYRKELQDLRNEYKKLSTQELASGGGRAIIDKYRNLKDQVGIYGGTLDQAAKAEDRMRMSADKTTPSIERQTQAYKRQSDVLVQLKSYAMNFLSVYAGIRLIKNLATITGEFEMQKISLQALLQDAEKGAKIFEQIKGLAVVSPFQFKDLVTYTKQLSAFSVPYTELYDTTKSLADLSAGLGVSMDRLIIAYGQVRSAAVLRGQELRQFTEAGIPIVEELRKKLSEANGELVTTGEVFEYISARKVPFEMVKDILTEMTSEGGKFYNMQAIQAETLKGKISNLTDAFQIMLSNIGNSDGGLMKGAVDATRYLIQNYETIGKILATVAITYGAYRGAVIAANTAELLMNGTYVAKIRLLRAAAVAQNILNASMMVNPYVLLATAVAGLGAAFLLLRDRSTAAEAAQKKLNDTIAESQRLAEEERARVSELINSIKDETKTRRERQLALNELQKMYPQIFSNLDLETAKNISLSKAISEVNAVLQEKSDLQSEERVVEITKELVKLRADQGKFIFAGTESYQVDNSRKINELEEERSRIIKKTREDREAEVEATIELADWQKTVNDFVKKTGATQFSFSDEDGTVYSYVQRIRREYEDLTDKYKIYSELVDAGSKKQAANYKEQIKLTEQLASAMGFSLKDSSSGTAPAKSTNVDENAMVKASERLSELRAKMALEEKKYALEVKQARVDAMEDGTEKELAQIALTKEKNLQAIEERKQAMINANLDIARAQWESEGKKGVFSEEIKLTESQIGVITSMQNSADIEELRSKELMFQKLLDQYKDYAQKVEDIEKKKNKDIADLNAGRTGSNDDVINRAIAEVQKKAKEETASLAFDEMKNSEAWRVLFSDLEDYTVKTLKESLKAVENTDISNLNAADAKSVQEGIDKLKKAIGTKDPFFALTKGWTDFISAVNNNQPDEAIEAINMTIKGAEQLLSVYDELQNLVSASFGEDSNASFITNSIGSIMGSTVTVGTGIKDILKGDINGIKEVINGVTGYINVFRNIRNRKYDKEIERQEKVVKSLEEEYRKLGKAMEDSLGADYYKNATEQAQNLKNQVTAINKQIDAEKKKGKDADKDKIAQLEQQRQDLTLESVEVVEDAIDKLTGTDLTSAAEDFAQSWLDAYISFGDTTQAMQDRFGEMMQDMIVNAMLAPIMQKWLKPVFDMIDKAWSDGAMTADEVASIWASGANAIAGANKEAEQTASWLENAGVDLRESESNLTGISKGVSTITEDTALVLGGYLNSIRQRMFEYIDYMMLPENRPAMSLLIQGQASAINHLQAIELNTKSTADSNNAILKKFEDVVISSGSGKGWAINVNA